MSFIILSNDFNLDAYAHVFLKANFKAQILESSSLCFHGKTKSGKEFDHT
jgi:hypothetical protein